MVQNQQGNLAVNLSNQIRIFGPACKLTKYNEFLITLMKISLGLLNKDIGDRFKVFHTLISQIFSTWLRATVKFLS